MAKPYLITFTGVDEKTDLDRLKDISNVYRTRVEWGFLVGDKKSNRYPSPRMMNGVLNQKDSWTNFAIHFCGAHTTRILAGDIDYAVEFCQNFPFPVDVIQLNARSYACSEEALVNLSDETGAMICIQHRDIFEKFPFDHPYIQPLFDKSGGRGVAPKSWPKRPEGSGQFVGYAGGIGPDNVVEVLENIDAKDGWFWIDMETNVRTDDWFDLDKCESVLRQVFG
jgi:phosphoribosylanthranilate isomerase